eukprot:m.1319001 g.1319001  ORF g.1319001 m.1319001 type:complete len:54 (+) comp24843_c0_seq3:4433-4594(+)
MNSRHFSLECVAVRYRDEQRPHPSHPSTTAPNMRGCTRASVVGAYDALTHDTS